MRKRQDTNTQKQKEEPKIEVFTNDVIISEILTRRKAI